MGHCENCGFVVLEISPSLSPLNRITSATVHSGNYSVSAISYDRMGNILALTRKGHTNSGATSFGIMDDLVYTYDSGNKLTKVLDNWNDTYGFREGLSEWLRTS